MTKTRSKSDVQLKFGFEKISLGTQLSEGERAGHERADARWIPGLPGQERLLEAMLRSKAGGLSWNAG
ncbi:hypothetical protein AB0P21_09625 [Kribbella sp. NPDC056861]|uniref:hypothetical protein n=1 Tax=Kribbella sp. NPDC056861 TaxID=3154857 RepID=UPI003430A4BD